MPLPTLSLPLLRHVTSRLSSASAPSMLSWRETSKARTRSGSEPRKRLLRFDRAMAANMKLELSKPGALIGLTGNIACGKSTVLRALRALGAYTIDADERVHGILMRGGPAYEPVVEAFGNRILGENGEI